MIQQARESTLAKKQQQESAARAEELASELGELREELVESQSQELVVRGEEDEEMRDVTDEAEEEEVRAQLRTSSTVRFAASPTAIRSTPPLSSPTPTTHTLTHTTTTFPTRSPSPTGSLDLSPSPSPPPPPRNLVEEQQEEENKKRKREFSPYDPRGPRPSQMVTGEEGWSSGMNAEDEDEEEEGEGMEE